jgi:hypothetical protein
MYMLDPRFRNALEEYQRKRYYPADHPDPLGTFAEFVNIGMVNALIEEHRKGGERNLLFVSHYILKVLHQLLDAEIFSDFVGAMQQKVMQTPAVFPRSVFYHARTLDDSRSVQLWGTMQKWCGEYASPLHEWTRAVLDRQRETHGAFDMPVRALAVDLDSDMQGMDQMLRGTLDLFAVQLRDLSSAGTLPGVLRSFRLDAWRNLADWSDFPAQARAFGESWSIRRQPVLRSSEQDESLLMVFPIHPPDRVTVEYGVGTGPLDQARFASALVEGCFHAGMNPELPAERRICGDPSLAPFWGYLYSLVFASPAGQKRYAGPTADRLASSIRTCLKFWFRYDTAISLFRHRAVARHTILSDLYPDAFAAGLPLEVPEFLYLYDLVRSDDAWFRTIAFRNAVAAEERLKELYGTEWFISRRWSVRLADYWWEGYRVTAKEVADDLGFEYCSHLAFS